MATRRKSALANEEIKEVGWWLHTKARFGGGGTAQVLIFFKHCPSHCLIFYVFYFHPIYSTNLCFVTHKLFLSHNVQLLECVLEHLLVIGISALPESRKFSCPGMGL